MYPAQNDLKTIGHWFTTDTQLNKLYPASIQLLAARHWTPLNITQLVAPFLNTGKVLDIGSGVGTFCLAGAYYKPTVSFLGLSKEKIW